MVQKICFLQHNALLHTLFTFQVYGKLFTVTMCFIDVLLFNYNKRSFKWFSWLWLFMFIVSKNTWIKLFCLLFITYHLISVEMAPLHTEKRNGKCNITYGKFVQFRLKRKRIYLFSYGKCDFKRNCLILGKNNLSLWMICNIYHTTIM